MAGKGGGTAAVTVQRFAAWQLIPGRSTGSTLTDYLGHLGIAAREPSREALNELHEAHVRSFTFDNIDVPLGQQPGVGLAAVQEKFVGRGRGGYCFPPRRSRGSLLPRVAATIRPCLPDDQLSISSTDTSPLRNRSMSSSQSTAGPSNFIPPLLTHHADVIVTLASRHSSWLSSAGSSTRPRRAEKSTGLLPSASLQGRCWWTK
jgi:hypothetical protein